MELFPAPLNSCLLGVSGAIPRTSARNVIESSIDSASVIEHTPVNSQLDGSLTDNFVDYNIHPVQGLTDLSDLTLELKGYLTKEDGTQLVDADNVLILNNGLHSLIKSVTVIANNTQIEFSGNYSINSYINQITGFSPHDLLQRGELIGLRDPSFAPKQITDQHFADMPESLKRYMKRIKDEGIHFKGPLMIDIATVSSYLLSGVHIKIKIELHEPSYYLCSPNLRPKLKISSMKLFTRVLKLRQNMALGLENTIKRSPVVYSFRKQMGKSFVIPSRQTHINIENPFISGIPEKIFIVMIDHQAYVGSSYKSNSFYFDHNQLKRISITLNDSYKYNCTAQFPSDTTDIYYETLRALGSDHDHLLNRNVFEKGTTILAFNLNPELLKDALHLNKTGVLRVNIELTQPSQENISLYMLGEFQSYLKITHERQISLHHPS